MDKSFRILWDRPETAGTIELHNAGTVHPDAFEAGCTQALFTVTEGAVDPGAFATVVTVRASRPFSFFLRDIRADAPVWIPEYGVIVTEGGDTRTYGQIEAAIRAPGRISALERMEREEEESFEHAAAHTRNMPCCFWMGLSRDVRMFEYQTNTLEDPAFCWDRIQPLNHHDPVIFPEIIEEPLTYHYFAGRGIGCRHDVHRRLEDGVLPILNVTDSDGPVRYSQTLFTTLERSPLVRENVRGTNFMVSETCGAWRRDRLEWEQKEIDRVLAQEPPQTETTVACLRITAENTADAPKYAFLRIPQPNVPHIPEYTPVKTVLRDGICMFEKTGQAFMSAKLNGMPVQNVEYSVLLGPGEKAVWEFAIFHEPVEASRAQALLQADFDGLLDTCREYWREKLSRTARIRLPEKRIQEMMQAGFLHLDLICFGSEPDGTVAPCVGVYSPIGTESTPVIQYIEAMGDQELAGRAAQFFLDKQQENGYMQNYSDYESETGLGLWNAAQHYRFTHDRQWLEKNAEHLVRGCDFLDRWASRLRSEEFRHKGYGMIAGKVSDCHLFYPSFMMNSTFYAGVNACADVLEEISHPDAPRIRDFADRYLADIRDSFAETVATAPVVPASDGSWTPSIAEWANSFGPTSLFADGGLTFSHGTMVDTIQPGTYEMMYGVVEPDSVYADFIMKALTEYVTLENTGFSQPYYSVHPYDHIIRGETGCFLKEFYNNMSCLADRETYSFWEHTFRVSPHKTHEEAWFLNRCRWLLFTERKDAVNFLPGVPRRWLDSGEEIFFDGMATRYGKIALQVNASEDRIRAKVRLDAIDEKMPHTVRIRLPHPERKTAVQCTCGHYDAQTETVELHFEEGFRGEAETELIF